MENLTDGYCWHDPRLYERYLDGGVFDGRPLWSLFTDSATRFPHRPAVCDDSGRALTYAALWREADAVAGGFLSAGLTPSDRVLVQLPNRIEFAVVLLALLRAGLPPVLTLPAHRLRELRHLAILSDARAMVVASHHAGTDHAALARAVQTEHPRLRALFSIDPSADLPPLPRCTAVPFSPPAILPTHPALFLVSGGTTGLPKLIARSHEDYRYNVACSVEACGLGPEDVSLAVLPIAHNFPLACPGLLGGFRCGGLTVLTNDPSPEHAFTLIDRHRITVTALVPALARLWTAARDEDPAALESLRLLQVGGARLAEADARAAQRAFPGALQQVFGMAEGLVCHTRPGDDAERVATTQGRPMSPFDELRVVGPGDEAVLPGQEGELLVRGPYTLRGYYRAPAHNARAFTPDGFYRTGDRVRLTAAGDVIVTGRIKDVINRAGECIAADEIEDHLLLHPAIRQAAVVAVPDGDLGERVGAVIVCDGAPPTLAELRAFLAGQGLAPFKLPERLRITAALPLTPVGKIDKRRLADPVRPDAPCLAK